MAAGAQDRLDVTDEGHFEPGNPPLFVGSPPYATWTAYHNGVLVSEPDFYRILGQDDLAKRAESWKVVKTGLGWGGLGTITAGLSASLITFLVMGREGAGDMPFYSAAASVATGGGLWIAYLALGFNFRPLSEAREMADAYNSAHSKP